MNNRVASVGGVEASAATTPRLRGRWLVVARLGWIAAVLLVGAFFVVTLPSYYTYLQVIRPACHGCFQLDAAGVQTLQRLGLSTAAYAGFVIGVEILLLLGFWSVGGILFWRASADRVALLASLTLILGATYLYGPAALPPAWPWLPYEAIRFLGNTCFGLFLGIFPSGRLVRPWTRWLVLLWIVVGADAFLPSSVQLSWPDVALNVVRLAGLIAVQVYRYRRVSTPIQRQQTKWAVMGFVLGLAGYTGVFVVTLVLPPSVVPLSRLDRYVTYFFGVLLTLFIALGIGLAVLRARLFDIDIIIRRTLVYGSLTAILAGVYLGVVIGLQSLVTALTHQTNPQPVIIVASTLLIAMLANPVRRQVQATIDRRFYRTKYDAARMLEAFAATLRAETDLSELSGRLMEVVQKTMQPASVSLWLRVPRKMPRDERTVGSD